MIDINQVTYDLVTITPSGQRLHLAEAQRGLQWEELPGELAVRLQAEFKNIYTPYGWLHKLLPLAGRLMLYADQGRGPVEIWRGTTFDVNVRSDGIGSVQITAYDMLVYLTKSKDNRYYKAGTKGRTILKDIAKAWGIPLGTVQGPDVTLPKQPFRGATVGEMIFDVLDQSKKRGAGKFIVRANAGKMEVLKHGQNSIIYHFGSADNVQVAEDRQSIEDLVTRVKIIGSEGKGGRSPVIATINGSTQFGILQEIVTKDKSDSPAAAKKAAQEILAERGKPKKTRRVIAPDVPTMRRGDKVHIVAGTLNGYYIVAGVQHDADNRTMTMEVDDI